MYRTPERAHLVQYSKLTEDSNEVFREVAACMAPEYTAESAETRSKN